MSRWAFSTASVGATTAPAATTGRRHLPIVVTGVLVIAAITVAIVAAVVGTRHRSNSPTTTTVASTLAPGDLGALHSVACSSHASCLAVGSYRTHGGAEIERGLVEMWDGASWSFVPSPSPATDTQLQSIACASRTSCMAVGIAGPAGNPSAQRAFAEMWHGSSWNVVPVPSPGTPSAFQAIACTSTISCTAVGSSRSAADGFASALVESWDGSRWSIVPAPSPPTSYVSGLHSIACPGPTSCVAVGSYSNNFDSDNPDARTLVESWNGTAWSVVPSPNPGNGYHSVLLAIACASPNACVAVGDYSGTGDFYKADDQTLVEVWSGSAWSVTPTGSLGTAGQRLLNSIACTSSISCVAVGSTSRGADQDATTLAESWNGTSWSLRADPAINGAFDSVACPAPTLCVAVGEQSTAGRPSGQLVVERLAPS